jgi:hypothetical protein
VDLDVYLLSQSPLLPARAGDAHAMMAAKAIAILIEMVILLVSGFPLQT